jgi:ribosomal protein S18 acetylase RimI-like enzyme
VFIYFDEHDEPVGFGALGPMSYRFPTAQSPLMNHLQLVYAGVDLYQRGKGYFNEIIIDLLDEAEARSPATFVTLFVDEKNKTALDIYRKPKFGFKRIEYLDETDPETGVRYLAMYAMLVDEAG